MKRKTTRLVTALGVLFLATPACAEEVWLCKADGTESQPFEIRISGGEVIDRSHQTVSDFHERVVIDDGNTLVFSHPPSPDLNIPVLAAMLDRATGRITFQEVTTQGPNAPHYGNCKRE